MDMQAEIDALKARVEALENRIRLEDAFEVERQRVDALPKRRPPSMSREAFARETLVATCRSVLRPVLATLPPDKVPSAIAGAAPGPSLRIIADTAPGVGDGTRATLREMADEATRLGITWAELGITAGGA